MPHSCLILDDSRLVRAIARAMLESLGMTVLEAADARDALVQCAVTPPDMVLVDWNMPDMNGLEFISALRNSASHPQPHILLCSTEKRLGAVRGALRLGADSYILKPFDKQRLAHRLRRFGFV